METNAETSPVTQNMQEAGNNKRMMPLAVVVMRVVVGLTFLGGAAIIASLFLPDAPPPAPSPYGQPVLKYGVFGMGANGGSFDLVCANGTFFREYTDYTGNSVRSVWYRGQLRPADMTELKTQLGTSFVLDNSIGAPKTPSSAQVEPVDLEASYTGGGPGQRKISSDDFSKYELAIMGFKNKLVPASTGEIATDPRYGLPGAVKVPSVDCKPR